MAEALMSPLVREYLDSLVPERPEEVKLMEQYAQEHSFPIVGPASGQFCYMLARAAGVRRVFEMGSGYGYSTYWFARAVMENGGGEVHHVVWDAELSKRAQQHLARLGLGSIVRFHKAEAVEELKKTEGPFDLIFNDIDKEAYPESLPVIESKLRPGGILIVDNMLWSGRIFDRLEQDPQTKGVKKLTSLLTKKPDWICSLIPIRDGLMVGFKSGQS